MFIDMFFKDINNYLHLNFKNMFFNVDICLKMLEYKIFLLEIFKNIIIINISISFFLFVLNYFFNFKKNSIYYKIFIKSAISLFLFICF